jgi:DNA-binding NtrC family response regulator
VSSLALVATSDRPRAERLTAALATAACRTLRVDRLDDLCVSAVRGRADLLIIAFSSGQRTEVFDAIAAVRAAGIQAPLLLITDDRSPATVVAALRARAADFFHEPLDDDGFAASVRRCLVSSGRRSTDRPAANSSEIATPSMIGNSAGMRRIDDYLTRVARSDASVLITGETGTGKELAAVLVHERSARRKGRFVSVNCAAIPEGLLESELFGYESGAFTGAGHAREGLLQIANGGTVFLDEVGEMGAPAQAKVLRAIETREVYRLGGRRPIKFDVRIVAATNLDPEQAVEQGRFRKDLYFRLNVARLHLPALRERRTDVVLLLDHYLRDLNRRHPVKVAGFRADAVAVLTAYDWPGNVRELKNLVEAVFVCPPDGPVTIGDLPDVFRARLQAVDALPDAERRRLLDALFEARWNKSRAAQQLRCSRMTLYRKMAKYSVVKAGLPRK